MIDTNAIRKKVLSLAMQGELTEQFLEDGNAKELYNNIQLEMLRLLKEKKIKKIVCKGTMEEGEFSIPDNWIACNLTEIAYSVGSKKNQLQTKEVRRKGKYPVISQGLQNVDGYSDVEEKVIVDVPVVLFGDHTRNVKYIDMPFVIGADGTKILKPIGIDSVFFYYAIKNMANRIETRGYSRHFAQLAKKWFFLPPRSEQVRIVNRIKEVFETIDKIDELQSQYFLDIKLLKSKLIDAGIQGKLTEQLPKDDTADELFAEIQVEKAKLIQEKKIKKEKALEVIAEDEIPFDVPDNWKWVRLGDICSKISSGNTPTGGSKGGAYVREGYCFFREQNIYNDGIRYDGMVYITENLLNTRPNSTVLPKDILLNITGGSIGRCALIPDDFSRGSINQHILIIRVVDPRIRFYIHKCLCSPYYQKLIMGNVVGDKDGFSAGRCKNTLIPLPPIAEQIRIVDKIDELLSLI